MSAIQNTCLPKWRCKDVSPLLFALFALFFAVGAKAATPPGVYAWGYNNEGELGDATITNRSVAASVVGYGPTGALTKVVSTAGGYYHSLALSSDGTVWSWGNNSNGQLGDDTVTNRLKPVRVSNSSGTLLTDIIALAAGDYHSLALTADGHVWAWGYNGVGQLGDGTSLDRSEAVPVTGLSSVIAIAAGSYHSLALTADGKVYAWGYNSNGQLGQGGHDFAAHPMATVVPGLPNVKAISCGFYHSLALLADGSVRAWGYNFYGALGDGTTTERDSPVLMLFAAGSPIFGISAIAAGGYHTALLYYGFVLAVGYNAYGQLGDGTLTNRVYPVSNGFGSVRSIAAGGYHTLALKQGVALGCGFNLYGQLGDGTTTNRSVWTPAVSVGQVSAIAGGGTHTLAVRTDTDGTGAAWGYNGTGALGDSTIADRNVPVTTVRPPDVMSDVISVAGGFYHSLALTSDGRVWTWGDNAYGQLGDGTFVAHITPKPVGGLPPIVAISAGVYFSMALAADGTVWTWGDNTYGQIGNGPAPAQSPAPVMVPNQAGIIAIAAGGYHALTLRVDGEVFGWGYNADGELADGTNMNRVFPVFVGAPGFVTTIAAGIYHSLAITADGIVWTWGLNNAGQLGDTTTTSRNYVKAVFSPAKAVAGGGLHSLALRPDGLIFTTGYNASGQLGDGTLVTRSVWGLVPNLKNNTAIASGGNFSLSRIGDGTAAAWGYDAEGELGDGMNVARLTPAPVSGLYDVRGLAAGFLHGMAIAPQGAKISGTLTFQGIAAALTHNQNVTFLLVPMDGTPRFTRTLSVPPAGNFTLTDIPRKSYLLWIKGDKYLADVTVADTSAGDVSGIVSLQLAGDANNDNAVDIGDFGLLVSAYGSSASVPGSGYDETADFNDDGMVDIGDFGLLVSNYGSVGAPIP